jgi:hypothetical protein
MAQTGTVLHSYSPGPVLAPSMTSDLDFPARLASTPCIRVIHFIARLGCRIVCNVWHACCRGAPASASHGPTHPSSLNLLVWTQCLRAAGSPRERRPSSHLVPADTRGPSVHTTSTYNMRHFVDFEDETASQNPRVESEPMGQPAFKEFFVFAPLCHSAHHSRAAFSPS